MTNIAEATRLDVKVHFQSHGRERCMYVEFEMMELQNFGFWGFCSKLRNEVPALQNIHAEMMKVTFRDDQGDWVDASEKIFSKFLGAAVYESKFGPNPRISVKIFEDSPFVCNKSTDIHVSARDKAEGLMKKLKAELDTKIKMEETVNQSFEAKIKPFLINSNQGKYLFDGYKERSRLILADTAILRKHYKGVIPSNIENESNKWQEIIKIFEERNVPKQKVPNPVRQLLEANPIYNVQFPQISNMPMNSSFHMSGLPKYQYIWTYPPITQPSAIARGATIAPAALGCPTRTPHEFMTGRTTTNPHVVQQIVTAGESDPSTDVSGQPMQYYKYSFTT